MAYEVKTRCRLSIVRARALVLLVICLMPSCGARSFPQTHYLHARRTQTRTNHNGSARSLSPVSYRSQRSYYASDADTSDERLWYHQRGYRPWKVDFSPKAPGTYSWTSRIVMANVFCYALQVFFPSITDKGVKISDRILNGQELYRLVTPTFLHGGITHLMTNVYSLQSVGHDVERYFGPGRYLFTYLVSGVVANYVSALKTPNPSLGASGAVFGVVGAYYVFLNRNMHVFGQQGEYMAGAITRTIMMNVFLGAMSPMVDNWSHLGGALGGAAAAYLFGPRLMLGSTPTGFSILVDKPILRLPRSLESIPEKVADKFRLMKRRMQVERFKSDLPEKPWRKKRIDYRKRRDTPSKSVRPSF